jgi:hypothetical protein
MATAFASATFFPERVAHEKVPVGVVGACVTPLHRSHRRDGLSLSRNRLLQAAGWDSLELAEPKKEECPPQVCCPFIVKAY